MAYGIASQVSWTSAMYKDHAGTYLAQLALPTSTPYQGFNQGII